jgi:drug/metabolite transporter (DMT)-like permease
MELWIPITIGAAFFQNLRSALQKHLKSRLSTHGATYARFVYAVPFVAAYVAVLAGTWDMPLPSPNLRFAAFTLIGGTTQIVATFLLIHLFSYRNFAVGTTYSKTETVQTAVFGMLILGDRLHPLAALGIVVSLVGVMLMSAGHGPVTMRALVTGWTRRPAVIGIVSGTFFGISIVSYRAASLSLEGTPYPMQAATTLLVATVYQSVAMALWMRLRAPGEITRVIAAFRVGAVVGLSGMLASACWLPAATLKHAAYVRALGQVELVFVFVASVIFFHEQPGHLEVIGILLVGTGIVLLLMA